MFLARSLSSVVPFCSDRPLFKIAVVIEEISIFSNSSYLEWKVGLSDTILKGTHTGTIPARFILIWFSHWSWGGLSQ
jgi:hypothetical protein